MSSVEFKAKGSRAEIWLYDTVGESWSGGVTSKEFAKQLTALGKVNTINLRINSIGGDVFEGLAIYNLLKQHPAQIVVDIDGLAASIASVIAMAADAQQIRIARNAMMMIHDPMGAAFGSASEMQRMAALLNQVKDNLAGTYAARTGQPLATLDKWMADETWFTAETAVESGFADEITAEQSVGAYFDAAKFCNVPDALKRRMANAAQAADDMARVRIQDQQRRLARSA